MGELAVLYDQIHKHHKQIPPMDANLENIRQAIFAWFGIKEREPIEQQLAKISFPKVKVTDDEIRAWEKAGYKPSLNQFVKKYRNGLRKPDSISQG